MKRLVIVGGGISGLTAAWRAAQRAAGCAEGTEILVLERDGAVGGKVKTVSRDGWMLETGPTGYLDNEPVLDELVEDLGLESERITADDAAAHRFVVHKGKMREVEANPIAFARAGILGPGGLLRILAEPVIRKRQSSADESVWDFARRRLGRQAADRLIAPMVLGVFAGDARRLSLPAAFPRLASLEAEHGSLVRGMIKKKRAARKLAREGGSAESVGGPSGPAGVLTSFREGLETLPRTLASRGRFPVRCGTTVAAVTREEPGPWRIALEGEEALVADAVILAGEPWAMAPLVQHLAPPLARKLDAIACPPVSVIGMGFQADAVRGVPRGFGVLIPRGEGFRILGCLWDSYIFPGRSPGDTLLLRAMAGGSVDPDAANLHEEELIELVRGDLRRLLGITAAPTFTEVARWPRAIPQYELGHLDRVAAIERERQRHPGLFIAGNALHGIAFGKAAAAGATAGEQAAEFLTSAR